MSIATNRVVNANEHHRSVLLRLSTSRDLHQSMPTNHVHALLPYATRVLESYASPMIVLDEASEQLLGDIVSFISRMGYEEAVPALVRFAQAHPDVNSLSANRARGVAMRLDERLEDWAVGKKIPQD